MVKSRGGWVAIGAVAVVLALTTWWIRRPHEDRPGGGDPVQGSASGDRDRARPRPRPPVPAHRVAGIVLVDDQPLAGATVRAISRELRAGVGRPARVVTDADGRFDLGELTGSQLTVVAEKPRLTSASQLVDLRDAAPAPPPDQLRLVLHACDAALSGTVRDSSGGAIAKARVALPLGGGSEADDDGRYELCIPVGDDHLVEVSADGYATASARISAYGRVQRDFQLVPEAIVAGRAIRADDKRPVAGAMIELTATRTDYHERALLAVADDDGRFRIEGAAPGRYQLHASADRLVTRDELDVFAEVGNEEPVTAELTATLAIAGKVVEKGTGTPIGSARISVYGEHTIRHTPEAFTGSDGTFEIDHVLPGNYGVAVRGHFADERKLTVGASELRGVVIEVERGGVIEGRVTASGKPVDGARVSSSYGVTESDAGGRFVLRGLPAGKLAVSAESKRLGAFTTGARLELGAGERRTGVELVLDLAGSIEGRVTDQRGAPVDGLVLDFSLLRGSDVGTATTDQTGRFKVGALSGGGDYVVRVRAPSGVFTYEPADGKRFRPIAVRDGQTHVTGVELAIRVERLAIAGRVTGSKGPVADAVVTAALAVPFGAVVASTRTDVDGAFTLAELRAGAYRVTASSARTQRTIDSVAAGRRDVVLELLDPGAIAGTLDGFPPQVTVLVVPPGERERRATVSGSTFAIRDLAPGAYRIYARSDDATVLAEAVVTSGNTTQVAIKNPGSGTLEGVAVDEAGRPIEGAHCGDLRGPTDASGRFRTRATAGVTWIYCEKAPAFGDAQVTVIANQVVEVTVVLRGPPDRPHGVAGFEVEAQLDDVLVASIVAGGPAERAGLAVGDVIVEADGNKPWSNRFVEVLERKGPGATVKLVIERDDKQRTVTLTLGAP